VDKRFLHDFLRFINRIVMAFGLVTISQEAFYPLSSTYRDAFLCPYRDHLRLQHGE
jgi:hypothetical protein